MTRRLEKMRRCVSVVLLLSWFAALPPVESRAIEAGDTRFSEIMDAIKGTGLEKGFLNSGSPPKTKLSDIDISELSPGNAEKLVEALNKKGFNFKVDTKGNSWRFIDVDKNAIIWKAPPDVRVGSPEHAQWVCSQAVAQDTFSTQGGFTRRRGAIWGSRIHGARRSTTSRKPWKPVSTLTPPRTRSTTRESARA